MKCVGFGKLPGSRAGRRLPQRGLEP
jgi:hypothetical protein